MHGGTAHTDGVDLPVARDGHQSVGWTRSDRGKASVDLDCGLPTTGRKGHYSFGFCTSPSIHADQPTDYMDVYGMRSSARPGQTPLDAYGRRRIAANEILSASFRVEFQWIASKIGSTSRPQSMLCLSLVDRLMTFASTVDRHQIQNVSSHCHRQKTRVYRRVSQHVFSDDDPRDLRHATISMQDFARVLIAVHDPL